MKKFLFGLLLLTTQVRAAIPLDASEFSLNRLSGIPMAQKYLLGSMIREGHDSTVCIYDFAIQGGAVGTVNTSQPVAAGGSNNNISCSLPKAAIVRGGFIDVVTAVTSGGSATVSLGLNSTTDLLAATLKTSLGTGRTSLVPVFSTVSGYIKTTAVTPVTASIAVAALTAGRIRVFLDYVQSE